MKRIALCHFNFSLGPMEKNIEKMLRALEIAGANGVDWLVTPETSLQGYYFHRLDMEKNVDPQPAEYLLPVLSLAKKLGITLFLGYGEYSPEDKCNYNVCAVYGKDGCFIGKHKKTHAYGVSESWAACGKTYEVFAVDGIKVAPLVCADAWYLETWQDVKAKEAQLIIDVAAWPPTEVCGNPLPKWMENSQRCNLPIILCNQTGQNEWMNMDVGQSVVIINGECKLQYNGAEALLIFDIDEENSNCVSDNFYIKAL